MTALKVFHGLTHRVVPGRRGMGQVQVVIAAPSRAAVGRAMEEIHRYQSRNDLRDGWSETGNDSEIAAAMAKPGVVLWRPLDDYRSPFFTWDQDPGDDQ